jgi:hypothetical protein
MKHQAKKYRALLFKAKVEDRSLGYRYHPLGMKILGHCPNSSRFADHATMIHDMGLPDVLSGNRNR